jgi:hypothetical protein
MAYTIQKTDGTTLISVPDTEKNTNYGVTLIGRNYSGYGVFLNDNFVSLMENFNKTTPPAQPLEGQLWYNPDTYSISLWDDRSWKRIGHISASSNAPTAVSRAIGDLWWDTTNQQLKAWAGENTITSNSIYSTSQYIFGIVSTDAVRVGDVVTSPAISLVDNVTVQQVLNSTNVKVNMPVTVTSGQAITFTRGSAWNVVGPYYTSAQQITGIYPSTIKDVNNVDRVVGLIYQKGKIIGSVSKENEFTPNPANAIDRLPVIKPGITMIDSAAPQFVRSVQANVVGTAGQTVVSLSNTDTLSVGDYVISANIAYSAGRSIQEIYANNSIRINTATTFTINDVITFQRGSEQALLFNGTATNAQQLNGVTADRFASLSTDQYFQQDLSVGGNLYVTSGTLVFNDGGNVRLYNQTQNKSWSFYSNISGVGNKVRVLHINHSTGELQASGDPVSGLGVATRNFVANSQGVALAAITANVNALINSAPVGRRDFGNISLYLDNHESHLSDLDTALALKAPILNTALTGVPVAPTAPDGTVSEQLATTRFVANAIAMSETDIYANAAVQYAQIQEKADINGPDFSGNPQRPHVSDSDRSRSIATTYFVSNLITSSLSGIDTSIQGLAPKASPAFTGSPTAPTKANLTYYVVDNPLWAATLGLPIRGGDSSLATTAFVANAIANMPSANLVSFATKVSPTFEGIPTAPTAPSTTANSWIATTYFVKNYAPVTSVNGKTGALTITAADISGVASNASPSFSGVPVLDTDPPAGDATKRIATTNFVANIAANLSPITNPTFIGTVTVPNPSDNSNAAVVATTAWVRTRIETASVPLWGGARKWVDTRAPLAADGNNGDIWFQYQV